MDNIQIANDFFKGWMTKDKSLLKMHPDLVHVSPDGTFEGRDNFMNACWEKFSGGGDFMKNARYIGDGDLVAVRYDVETPDGIKPFCEWLIFDKGEIKKITVFWYA